MPDDRRSWHGDAAVRQADSCAIGVAIGAQGTTLHEVVDITADFFNKIGQKLTARDTNRSRLKCKPISRLPSCTKRRSDQGADFRVLQYLLGSP